MSNITFTIRTSEDPRDSSFEISTELSGPMDITPYVRAFQVYGAGTEQTVVGVEFIKAKVDVSGNAFLTNLAAQDRGSAAAAVKALDPQKIEATALENSSMGDSMAQLMIDAIVEALDV